MKNTKGFIFFIIVFLFSLTFISAQPPFQQNIQLDKSIQIRIPENGLLKTNEGFHFHFHLFNSTNGLPIDNSLSPLCNFHLYNSSGVHLLIANLTYFPNTATNEWKIEVTGGNFTNEGTYGYLVQCSIDGVVGGLQNVGFEVSSKKIDIGIGESLLYFILAFGVLLLFFLSFYFMMVTPYSNKIDSNGAVIQLTKLKYVKLGLILLSWVLLTWFLNILIGLSDNFVSLNMYYGFFGFIFETMNNLALPLGIIIIVISFFEIIRDANIMKNIKKFGKG